MQSIMLQHALLSKWIHRKQSNFDAFYNDELHEKLSKIQPNDTIIFTFNFANHTFSTAKLFELCDIIFETVGLDFMGDIFYGCVLTNTPDQLNIIHLKA